MSASSAAPRLFAVTSGWDGPFQHHEVLVAAADLDAAIARAEAAFADVAQPVCRARMRVADLGALDDGLLVGPLRSGESVGAAGAATGRRCDPAG